MYLATYFLRLAASADYDALIILMPLSGVLWIWLARTAIKESRGADVYRRYWGSMITVAVYWTAAWLLQIAQIFFGALGVHPGSGGLRVLINMAISWPAVFVPSPFLLFFLRKYPPNASLNANSDRRAGTSERWLILLVIVLFLLPFFSRDSSGFPGLAIAAFQSLVGCWWIARLKRTSSCYWLWWFLILLGTLASGYAMSGFVYKSFESVIHSNPDYSSLRIGPTWWKIVRWIVDEPALSFPAIAWLMALIHYHPWKKDGLSLQSTERDTTDGVT